MVLDTGEIINATYEMALKVVDKSPFKSFDFVFFEKVDTPVNSNFHQLSSHLGVKIQIIWLTQEIFCPNSVEKEV